RARAQGRTGAHAWSCGAVEGRHLRPGTSDAVIRVAAGHVAVTGVPGVAAERDVLAGDVVLAPGLHGAVVVPGDTGIGGRALRPVEVAVLDDDLLGRVVAGGKARDQRLHGVVAEVELKE